jgi:hypothetical protein
MMWVSEPKPQSKPVVKAKTRVNENRPKPRKNYAVLRYRNIGGRVEVYCNGEWVEASNRALAELLLWQHMYPVVAMVINRNGYEVAVAVPVRKARRLGLLDCAVDLTVGANLPVEYPVIRIG